MSRGRDAFATQISFPGEEYSGPPPSRCVKFFYYTWKFCSVVFSHFIMICLVIAYSIMGAFVFQWLEADHERKIKESIAWIRGNFTHDIWRMTNASDVLRQDVWTGDVSDKLKAFEGSILQAMKRDGWDGIENPDSVQWTFTGALFYSIVVITTIGYGHIAPRTQTGKVTTILYAIIGIPLMLLCLSNIGDVMASSFRFLYWRVCCYVCTRPPKRRRRHRTLSRHPSTHRSVRGRAASTRRKARSNIALPTSLEPHAHSDTECRYRDSGYATTPGSANTRRHHPPPARVRSQPPPTNRCVHGDRMRRTRSFQEDTKFPPSASNRHARERYADHRVVDDEFPKISLPLKDLDAALQDLKYYERSRPGDFSSKSLPRSPRQRNRYNYRTRLDERNNTHSLKDIDYENFRERQARLHRQDQNEDREYDLDPEDDFEIDRPRRRYDLDRNTERGQSEFYDSRADYPEFYEPDNRRARRMIYEVENRCEEFTPRRYLRRLDTRDETTRKPYRYSISPERGVRSEFPHRWRDLPDDDWSDVELDRAFEHKIRRNDRLPG